MSELGGIPDEGLIERSNPETGMRDGPEWLVRKTQMLGAPDGGKRLESDIMFAPERWPSGRRRRSRKPVYP